MPEVFGLSYFNRTLGPVKLLMFKIILLSKRVSWILTMIVFLVGLLFFGVEVISYEDNMFYRCGGDGEVLNRVEDEFGPLCDGERNCQDNSDESFCLKGKFAGNSRWEIMVNISFYWILIYISNAFIIFKISKFMPSFLKNVKIWFCWICIQNFKSDQWSHLKTVKKFFKNHQSKSMMYLMPETAFDPPGPGQ